MERLTLAVSRHQWCTEVHAASRMGWKRRPKKILVLFQSIDEMPDLDRAGQVDAAP